MSWSLGEIDALCVKAARGVGMPWGLAQEAGFAVRWLEQRTHPGVEAFAYMLNESETQKQIIDDFSPIVLGATISDSGTWENAFPAEVCQPLLFIPFVSLVAENDSLGVSWADNNLVVNATGISSGMSATALITGVHKCNCKSGLVSTPSTHRLPRVHSNREPFVRVLEKFAHKTYAPSTEASRQKGAGAGLSDND